MKIKKENMAEFKGQVIDVFEDYLSAHNFALESNDRAAAIEDGKADDDLAILYGDLYDAIGDEIEAAVRGGESEEAVHIAALRGFAIALNMGNCERGIPGADLLALNHDLQNTIAKWAKKLDREEGRKNSLLR